MKNVVDCDSVFEILTQAPFPSGGSNDEEVETHLRVCHECRCLAEALRPAVGVFHESLADDESLPRYDGRLAEPQSGRTHGSHQTSRRAGAVVAAGLAACLLTWMSYLGGYQDAANSRGPTSRAAAVLPSADGFKMLCALQLPRQCLSRDERSMAPGEATEVVTIPWENADALEFACCTQCHRLGGGGPASPKAIRALNDSCAACHRRSIS